jgi:hypothetical protein
MLELLLELFRRYTSDLFELSAKMLYIAVSASVSYLCNRISMMSEKFFRQANSAMNDIIHTG